MAYFPIVRRKHQNTEPLNHRPLPTFYMEDFSVIGFQVNDCDQAMQILDQHAFTVRRMDGSREVDIETAARMQAVMQVLKDNGLECEITDIAEGMYQG